MDTIVCNFKLYELHQPIELMNSNGNLTLIAVSNFESLADDITKACEKYKTNKIHLFGNSNYANGLIQEIKNYSITKYNKNNLEIEVN